MGTLVYSSVTQCGHGDQPANCARDTRLHQAPAPDTPSMPDLSELSATNLSASESQLPPGCELFDIISLSSPSYAVLTAIAETSAPASLALAPADSPIAYALHAPQISMAVVVRHWRETGIHPPKRRPPGRSEYQSLSLRDADVDRPTGLELKRTPVPDWQYQGLDVLMLRLVEKQRRFWSSVVFTLAEDVAAGGRACGLRRSSCLHCMCFFFLVRPNISLTFLRHLTRYTVWDPISQTLPVDPSVSVSSRGSSPSRPRTCVFSLGM